MSNKTCLLHIKVTIIYLILHTDKFFFLALENEDSRHSMNISFILMEKFLKIELNMVKKCHFFWHLYSCVYVIRVQIINCIKFIPSDINFSLISPTVWKPKQQAVPTDQNFVWHQKKRGGYFSHNNKWLHFQ